MAGDNSDSKLFRRENTIVLFSLLKKESLSPFKQKYGIG